MLLGRMMNFSTAFQHGVWENWIPLQALNKQQLTAALNFLGSKNICISI